MTGLVSKWPMLFQTAKAELCYAASFNQVKHSYREIVAGLRIRDEDDLRLNSLSNTMIDLLLQLGGCDRFAIPFNTVICFGRESMPKLVSRL